MGRAGIRSAYLKGRGSIAVRAKIHVETIRKDRDALIVTEIPYQVNKATLQERIAELVREKRVEGIAEVRDESDRDGYRVVIELKREAMADVVLNQLYRFTSLQSMFAANMVALNGGRPEQHNLLRLHPGIYAIPRNGRYAEDKVPAREGEGPRTCSRGLGNRRCEHR